MTKVYKDWVVAPPQDLGAKTPPAPPVPEAPQPKVKRGKAATTETVAEPPQPEPQALPQPELATAADTAPVAEGSTEGVTDGAAGNDTVASSAAPVAQESVEGEKAADQIPEVAETAADPVEVADPKAAVTTK